MRPTRFFKLHSLTGSFIVYAYVIAGSAVLLQIYHPIYIKVHSVGIGPNQRRVRNLYIILVSLKSKVFIYVVSIYKEYIFPSLHVLVLDLTTLKYI
jgi:hypothetical protein